MRSIFRNNLWFFIPYFLFLVAGAVFLATHSRAETHLLINSYHNSFLDTVSPYITLLGDGWVNVITVVLLALIKFRYAILTFISFIIATLFTQGLRQTFFHGWPRPIAYFKGIQELHLVPGVEMHSVNTFPSGHTATAFAIYFCICLFVKNNWLKFFLLIFSLLTAFSRVYLSQHFFADVYWSSVLGIISALIGYYCVQTIRKNWPEKSLLTVFNRS